MKKRLKVLVPTFAALFLCPVLAFGGDSGARSPPGPSMWDLETAENFYPILLPFTDILARDKLFQHCAGLPFAYQQS